MISHEYQCIFIHIPKCAGTSIETALGHNGGEYGRWGQDHRSLRMIERPFMTRSALRSPANWLELLRRTRYAVRRQRNPANKHFVTKEQFRNYFKFTIVRNPWSRAYSWYENVLRDVVHRRSHGIAGDVTLLEFLQRCAGVLSLRPQTYWIEDYSGKIGVDYVGRFESLQKDFAYCCQRMCIDPPPLPHKLKGSGRDYRAAYDTESRDLVAEYYREEIELFGYTF